LKKRWAGPEERKMTIKRTWGWRGIEVEKASQTNISLSRTAVTDSVRRTGSGSRASSYPRKGST
jgi:hypothetical protein